MAEDEVLTLREVGDYRKLSERTRYRLTEGRLPGSQVGNSWRGIETWIEAQQPETQRNGEKE
jgi:hypothetical protein